jgi:hypothetical protein
MGNKRATVMAVRVLLAPIVRVLSSIGFNYRDFAETAKVVYVEVAVAEDRRRGRKTSLSRVGIVTGITRREVARLHEVVSADPAVYLDLTASITNLLHAWHTDHRFADGDRPRDLPLEGEDSLESLIQRHRGEVGTNTLVRELVRLGLVEIRPGFARPRVSQFHPRPLDPLSLQHFACVVHDVGRTAGANVLGHGLGHEGLRFEKRVIAYGSDLQVRAALKAIVSERVEGFIEELRRALGSRDVLGRDGHRLGVGAYVIDDD